MSNTSWPPEATSQAYELLQEAGFSGVEVAPGLLFPSEGDPRRPSAGAIMRELARAQRFGLTFPAMQSLHFGLGHAELFGTEPARLAFTNAIGECCALARQLGAGVLTLGSAPNRRRPLELDKASALHMARETLLPLADQALKGGVKLAIEPIPAVYGTNFVNTLSEALDFVRLCDHPALGLNFDTGAMAMSGEIDMLEQHYAAARPWIAHMHVGARQMQPVTREDAWLGRLARLVTQETPASSWMSAEMRPDPADGLAAARAAASALAYHAAGRSIPG
ncbi:MAG: sugar phosphate isomerase/epimerase family protein [Hyphomonadaceae bacterium]